jgi:Bacterial tandem repeat domain 1
MMTRRTVLSRATGLALLGGTLLGAPAAAATYGRIGFSKMAVDDCADMTGTCEWRMTCRIGGGTENEIFTSQPGAVAQDIELKSSFEVKSFPAKLECTLFEDDGWFGETWNEAGKVSLDLPGGGDYLLNIKGDQGTVAVTASADSFEMPDNAAAPAASTVPAAAKGAKPAKAAAVQQFVGGYLRDGHGHAVVLGLPWSAFKAKVDAFAAQGVKLDSLMSWEQGKERLWGGIFRSVPGRQELVTELEWEPFLARWKPLNDDNMKISDIEIYSKGSKFYFTGVYLEGTDENTFWLDDMEGFVRKWSSLSGGGLRLTDMEIYQAAGKWRYAGVFRGGSGPYGMRNAMSWDEFQTYWKGKEAEGRTGIVDIVAHRDGAKVIWDIATGGGQGKMTPMLDAAALGKDWKDRLGQGYRLTALETVP